MLGGVWSERMRGLLQREYFFFQAEDGIRDLTVTGVQTCALPICYGENGLMRIDPASGRVVWRLPLRAAWLGLARSGRDWRDTVWASGGGTNRVYRLAWQGGARWSVDTVTLADSSAQLFAAGGGAPPPPRARGGGGGTTRSPVPSPPPPPPPPPPR